MSNEVVFTPNWQDIYKFYRGIALAFAEFCDNERGALNKTKEMLMYFSLNLPDPASFRKLVGRCQTLEEMMKKFEHFLVEHKELCGSHFCSAGRAMTLHLPDLYEAYH